MYRIQSYLLWSPVIVLYSNMIRDIYIPTVAAFLMRLFLLFFSELAVRLGTYHYK